MQRLIFALKPQAPYRLDLTAWTLRRRADNLVDRWDGQTYRRVIPEGDVALEVAVTQTRPPDAPRLRIEVCGERIGAQSRVHVSRTVERLLGVRIDLGEFYELAKRDARLGELCAPFRGMRPPRYLALFEAAVNAMACQQVTLSLGIQLLNKLAVERGLAFEHGGRKCHAFPRPEDLADRDSAWFRALGFSHAKGRAIIELAKGVLDGRVNLEALAGKPDAEALEELLALRGVGRWTAEYMLLRGLGRLNIFPADDVGGRNNLQRWLGRRTPFDADAARKALKRWEPFGGLVYFHLLLRNIAGKGLFDAAGEERGQ